MNEVFQGCKFNVGDLVTRKSAAERRKLMGVPIEIVAVGQIVTRNYVDTGVSLGFEYLVKWPQDISGAPFAVECVREYELEPAPKEKAPS